MKVYFFCFFILTTFFSYGQIKEKNSILVLSVNFFTTTFSSVPCEEFSSAFEHQLRIDKIYSEDSIAILNQFIEKIKFEKKKKGFDFDTRAKLIYKNKLGNNVIICVNQFAVLMNGNLVRKNKRFFRLSIK
jgi:hypothetical protein